MNGQTRAVLHDAQRHVQLEAQTLDDGAVEVVARVVIGKADDRAERIRMQDAGRPVRLQEQTVAAGGQVADALVEQSLGRHAHFFGVDGVGRAEFLDEPRQQPQTAVDLDLGVVVVVEHAGVGGQELLRLDVLRRAELDRGRRTERDGRLVGVDHGEAKRLAALVRAGRDERQAGGDAGQGADLFGDRADDRAGRHEVAQLFVRHVAEAAREAAGLHPAAVFVVERDVADLVRGRVDEVARELVVQVRGQHDVFGGPGPDLRLVAHDPVADGGGVDHLRRRLHAGDLEEHHVLGGHGAVRVDGALVQPENDVAQGLIVRVQTHDRVADDGDGHGDHVRQQGVAARAQLAAAFAQAVEVEVRLLLGPAGLFREVGLGIFALHDVHDPAVRVHEQGACALCADVAGQHQRFAQDDSLLRFIFALYTKDSFGSVPEETARGDDVHAEAEHVRDHDVAAADAL